MDFLANGLVDSVLKKGLVFLICACTRRPKYTAEGGSALIARAY
jgi:hypothetical protein